jgi:NitT/TauT family transport system permease protein
MCSACFHAPQDFCGTFFVWSAKPPGFAKAGKMDLNLARKLEGLTNRNQWKYTHWIPPLAGILALLGWEALSYFSGLPAFILPSPLLVAGRFVRTLSDGSLLRHTLVTLSEVLLGLLSGTFAAMLLGYLIAKSRAFERLVSPFLVASQAVPIVALAPLLIIWFGPGTFSKVLICGLIVFFPVLVNTVVGLRAVPRSLHELMRSLRASRWQMLRHLEIPAALPVFLGGLRIGATLSVIGAVVGELVGADQGLGFLINVGRGQYDTALVFVAVFTLIVLALSLYGIVILLEKRFLAWQEKI